MGPDLAVEFLKGASVVLARQAGVTDQDWEDNAIKSEMDQVLEGLGHAGNAEMQAIYAALARLKSGIYGVCARCGDGISEERLDVLPHTPLCRSLRAQGRAEELGRRTFGGDATRTNSSCERVTQRRSNGRWTSSTLYHPGRYIEADVEAQKRVVDLV